MSKDEWDKKCFINEKEISMFLEFNKIPSQTEKKTKNILPFFILNKKCLAIIPLGTAQIDLKNYVLAEIKK